MPEKYAHLGEVSISELADEAKDIGTGAIVLIDYTHHEIHEGNHFMYTDSVELDSTETQDYLITTPNTTKWPHMFFNLDGSTITQF